ncbi:MAG: phosphoenolpyruvate--protein phosphotransferase [Acidobacteria bacterium 13_1_40CM_2_68_5]|nr:MAG: phosphoenolpyruvate--protein phosphotransferase [Acidobacteria bacterium 13_1_40CM_2_68_5]
MTDAAGPEGRVELRGIGVSAGIAIGRALVLEGPNVAIFRLDLPRGEADREVARLQRAVRRAWRQLRHLRDRVRSEAGEAYARVFEAQILILKDRSLHQETASLIRREDVNAEWAFHTVVGRYTQVFSQLGDQALKDRGTDIEDVEARVQAILTGSKRRHDLSELTEDVIVVSSSLSPSDAAGLNREHVIGLAIDGGGPTSHTAIIASALGIPAVAGLRDASSRVRTGDILALDGASGLLVLSPPDEETAAWRDRRTRQAQRELDLMMLRDQPAVTREGLRVRLQANVELLEEMLAARRFGAEGVGLYRSEFLYLHEAPGLPDEEAHYRAYRELAERALPHDVVIRTLDLGGEKYFSTILERRETNPVLGLRGIRLCLKREDLFRSQLRGILRAAAHGKVRVMFPMVSGLHELRRARAVFDDVRRELLAERVPCDPEVPLGIMIEVPAAALIVDRLAPEVDFFSIGTNDLIQYSLAIDRGNESVSYLYQPLHPAILGLIRGVVEAAARAGRRVSVCGEMAASPVSAVVLIGLGITELSMNPAAIPTVKQVIRALSAADARALVEEALRLDSAEEVEALARIRVAELVPREPQAALGVCP